MRKYVLLAALAGLGGAGCWPPAPAEDPSDRVRAKAAEELGCTGRVRLQEIRAKSSTGKAYLAQGCGQTAGYEVICGQANSCAVVRQDELTVQGPAPDRGGASRSAPDPGPAARARVSVTLRSLCPDTVKVFFGDRPRFSSGRTRSVSANSRQSTSLAAGDMIWLLNDAGDGISSVTVTESTREVEISRECTALLAR